MFGYVKVLPSELKTKEYDFYRAVYCSLCRQMGKCTGCSSRLTLSYDFVFLALVRSVLSGENFEPYVSRCSLHPTKDKNFVHSTPSLKYAARACAVLTYEKVRDDIRDTKGLKKIPLYFLRISARRAARRAGLPELSEKISLALENLSRLEKSKFAGADAPADIFGNLLADIFGYGLAGSAEKIAREAGYHIGKFIYAVDALDDMEKDKHSNSYNPFNLIYANGMNDEEKQSVKTAITLELSEVEKALLLMDFNDGGIKNIIFNIVYLGMPAQIDKALREDAENQQNKKGANINE